MMLPICPADFSLRTCRAFSLVEVVLAIGIVAFAFVLILALLPTGLNSVKDGKLQEIATEILSAAESDLRNTPRSSSSAASPIYGFLPYADSPQPATNDFNGFGILAPATNAVMRLKVTPRSSANSRLVVWHLLVEAPPQAQSPAQIAETIVVLPR